MKIRIATRESALAMVQTHRVAKWLRDVKSVEVEILGMTTQGDQLLDRKLDKIGGKGLFIKELEMALLAGTADLAVHSAKDMPAQLADGLVLVGVSDREDPCDVLLSHYGNHWQKLPQGAIVGTSSARREAQLRLLRPDLVIKMLRGNINTRIAKWKAKEYDAIVLAAAGLKRLNFQNEIAYTFTTSEMLPAVGQGILALEARLDFPVEIFSGFHNVDAMRALQAERMVLKALQADCSVPLGVHARCVAQDMHIESFYAEAGRIVRESMICSEIDMESQIQQMALKLKQGVQP